MPHLPIRLPCSLPWVPQAKGPPSGSILTSWSRGVRAWLCVLPAQGLLKDRTLRSLSAPCGFVTSRYKLHGLEATGIYSLTVPEARSLKLRRQQGLQRLQDRKRPVSFSFRGSRHFLAGGSISSASASDFPWPSLLLHLSSFLFRVTLFIYFYPPIFISGCAGSSKAFSGCGEWGLLFVVVTDFSWRRLLLFQSTGSRCVDFGSCSMRA